MAEDKPSPQDAVRHLGTGGLEPNEGSALMIISEPQAAASFHVVNVGQATAWDGEEGEHWTEHADRYDAAVRRYDSYLIDAARLAEDDRVLDVGCGAGVSTRDAASVARAGRALGIDLSARLVEEARRRSQRVGLTNTEFVQGDAQVHPFESEVFDVAISRFGAMFFVDPVAAFANVARTLHPGGRLVVLSWQELARNEWVLAIRRTLAAGRTLPGPPPGSPGPFGLAEEVAVRRILARAGFSNVELAPVVEPVLLGSDPEDAFAFVRGLGITKGLLEGLDITTRAHALEALSETLAAHATADGVLLDGAGWLITGHRA